MNLPAGSIEQRRARLATQISRQREELAEAYRNLERPLHYAEQGMRGFGFLRDNPWVLSAVPAAFSITSTLIGLVRNKPGKRRDHERHGREKRPRSLGGHVAKWGGHGWRLFQLYRRVRRFMP